MKTSSVLSLDPFALGPESQFYFNVVIVYDQRDSAIRAKTIFDRLTARFAGQFHFQCDFWRFDVLDVPEARQQAAWAGQIADLIIVSSKTGEVSFAVKEWLETCVGQKNASPSALVELFNDRLDDAGLQPEMKEFLRPFANGVDFFVHEIDAPSSRTYASQESVPSKGIRLVASKPRLGTQ